MKAPVATSMRQGDHGPQARSNCKKISPQHAQTRANRQTRILPESRNSRQIKALGVLHGRLTSNTAMIYGACLLAAVDGTRSPFTLSYSLVPEHPLRSIDAP